MKKLTPKRSLVLAVTALAVVGSTALQAGAIGLPALPLAGSATLCLTDQAKQALATAGITYAATSGATDSAPGCVKMLGKGALATDLLDGDIAFEGGLRFAGGGHTLDLTQLTAHVGQLATSADTSVDGGTATNVDFVHYTLSLGKNVSISMNGLVPDGVTASAVALNLTGTAVDPFAKAFGTSPFAAGDALFNFDGTGTFDPPALPGL